MEFAGLRIDPIESNTPEPCPGISAEPDLILMFNNKPHAVARLAIVVKPCRLELFCRFFVGSIREDFTSITRGPGVRLSRKDAHRRRRQFLFR